MSSAKPQPILSAEETGLRTARKGVETSSVVLVRIVDQIVYKYFKELDAVVDEVYDKLRDKSYEFTLPELDYYIALLPNLMYYAGNCLETLGVEGDTAEAIRQDMFNAEYIKAEGRTIQEKTSFVEQLIVNEQLMALAYKRAYKKARIKLDYADSLLASLKKVHAHRMLEYDKYSNSNGVNFKNNSRR